MPYRTDGRSDEARASHRAELAAALEEATRRLEAARGSLEQLEERFDRERRQLDAALADADDTRRVEIHRSMALGAAEPPTLRDRLRTGGAVTALERAMATRQRSSPPPARGALAEAQADLQALRARRAELHARSGRVLSVARGRLAEAQAAHDEASTALEDIDAR
ncbi:MAG: hypothetical protein H6719_03295 [Sandaracinaceae bacterium]|nr:hypothetical protein [Sandaracinaceae bacterium]